MIGGEFQKDNELHVLPFKTFGQFVINDYMCNRVDCLSI